MLVDTERFSILLLFFVFVVVFVVVHLPPVRFIPSDSDRSLSSTVVDDVVVCPPPKASYHRTQILLPLSRSLLSDPDCCSVRPFLLDLIDDD